MSRLDTLARHAASELHSEVKSTPVPLIDLRQVRERQIRRIIRTSVLAAVGVVIVVGVPIWLGSFAPEEPVAPPTTIPETVTTTPDMQEEGKLTVETSLGTWQWVRDEEPGLSSPLPDDPIRVELPDPPLPEIEELVWPQIKGDFAGLPWDPLGGFPVSSGDVTITPAQVFGGIDWNRFYTNSDGWVEGKWRPLDGDCPWVEVCSVQTATLEILAVREVREGGGASYPVGAVLDVLVASIVSGPDAVEFRDEGTGELVLRVEANDDVTAQQLLRAGQFCVGGMSCGGGLGLWELFVDGVGWIHPPWQGMDLLRPVVAGVRDDGFWIVGVGGPQRSRTLHAWGSSDGVNWEEMATPFPLGDSLPYGVQQVDLIDGQVVILTPHQNPDEPLIPPKVLRLVGGEFTEVEVDLSPLGLNMESEIHDFRFTPWGWMATTWTRNTWAGLCSVWASADGTSWEEITTPDGTDIGETVNLYSYVLRDDGSAAAENPEPTPSETVSAEVRASQCWVGDDHSVYLEFEHILPGTGPEEADLPDFYSTFWLGRFVGAGSGGD